MKARLPLALLLALAAPACFAADAKLVVHEKNGIEGRYIVVMKPSAERISIRAAADSLARRYGATAVHYYEHALVGFSAKMPAHVARQLSQDPRVAYVEQSSRMQLDGTQQIPAHPQHHLWNLDRLDQSAPQQNGSYTWNADGTGVNVYVLDSGIRTTHEQFEGRATFAADFTGLGDNNDACLGHGTAVAGVVAGVTTGVAKAAKVHSVRVVECDPYYLGADAVIAGVDWVTRNAKRPAVANMSLGLYAGDSPTLNAAVRTSISSGITYAVSAGNEGFDASTRQPADVAEALTVGGLDRTDSLNAGSNRGALVDVYAPWEAYTASNASNTSYALRSGTSLSTPHVTGVAAQYLSMRPYATPAEVANAIVANAATGLIPNLPAGSHNRLLQSTWVAPSLSTTCTFGSWSSVTGSITTGTPQSSPSHKRLSDPCALRTTAVGSYVTDATPAAFATYGSRFYFYPEGSSTAPITLFRAKNTGGATVYSVRYSGSTIEVLNQNGVSIGSFAARVWGWNSVELRWSAYPTPTLTTQTGYVNGTSSLVSPGGGAVGASLDRIETIELGQIAGAASPMVIHFDAFTSRASDLPIGREMRGDANRDGGVSGPDIVLVTNEAGGGTLTIGQPDCNEDGGVSGPDIVCTTNIANGVWSQ